jgi:exodeoxyribonuclease VII small subunit
MAKFKYDEALARLQEISQILENEVEDINKLSDLIKESAKLVRQCKKHLNDTSAEIENTLDNLEEPLA